MVVTAKPALDGKKRRYVVTVPPYEAASTVRLQAVAYDDDGLRSPREELVLNRREPETAAGRLLGLCVGVSRYQDPSLSLKHAAGDAEALGQLLRGQGQSRRGGLYSRAEVTVLTDARATRAAVRGALERLARTATPRDTVLLFLSGHGWRGGPGQFYFATHEVRRDEPRTSSLGWGEVIRSLTPLARRSRRVLVLLDACHSGSAATNDELVRAMAAAEVKVLVLASSRRQEQSLESPDLGHGIFTQALLEGMEGRAAPASETRVNLWDLLTYVRRRVRDLSEGAQNPQVPFLQDFDTDEPFLVKQ